MGDYVEDVATILDAIRHAGETIDQQLAQANDELDTLRYPSLIGQTVYVTHDPRNNTYAIHRMSDDERIGTLIITQRYVRVQVHAQMEMALTGGMGTQEVVATLNEMLDRLCITIIAVRC